jgi:Uma2 family endonuclease
MSLPQTRELFTVEEYLEMERASEVRHEYLDGEIFEMSGETLSHGRISTNLVSELRRQLRGRPCDVLSKDMKVRSGWLPSPRRTMKGLFSYPDVVVVCGQPQFHDEYQDILTNPNVIIEVLSDATEKFDRGEKFRRYRAQLPTLTDYVLVSQTKPFIDHFIRREGGAWMLVPVEGLEHSLRLASIDCVLPLAEIYDRVEFPPDEEEPADEI